MLSRLFQQPQQSAAELDDAEKHFNQGLQYRDRKSPEFDFALALEHFEEAVRLDPETGKYHEELGRAYVAAPILAITRGISNKVPLSECVERGVIELTRALVFDSSHTEIHLVLGEAHMYLGKKQKAIENFKAAIASSSFYFSIFSPFSFIDSWLLKSYARRRIKNLENPKGRLPQPGVAQKHIERATVYRDEGRYDLAEKELMQAYNYAPDWAWIYKVICKGVG